MTPSNASQNHGQTPHILHKYEQINTNIDELRIKIEKRRHNKDKD